ncbi:MAG: translation initiation factor IF-5A [Candidatus Micrarchaeota archaeon]|jgi:translation initiation factor 5A
MASEIMYIPVKDVKEGRFILIDNVPCKVVEIETSAPGKHGSAKVRITAIGIFDGQKRTLLKPSSADVEAPVIVKKRAQVVSIIGNTAQLMDLESYETYELPIPQELMQSIKPGAEVEVIESMDQRAISRVLGGV